MEIFQWKLLSIINQIQTTQTDSGDSDESSWVIWIAIGIVILFVFFASSTESPAQRARKLINSIPLLEAKKMTAEWACLIGFLKTVELNVTQAQAKLDNILKTSNTEEKQNLVGEVEKLITEAQNDYEILCDRFHSCQDFADQIQNLVIKLSSFNWGNSTEIATTLLRDTQDDIVRAKKVSSYSNAQGILTEAHKDLKNNIIKLSNNDISMSRKVQNIFQAPVGLVSTGDQTTFSKNKINIEQYSSQTVDLETLADELSKLRRALKKQATRLEHDTDIGLVAQAQIEARNGNKEKVKEYVSKFSGWVLQIATEIGANVIAEIIKAGLCTFQVE